MKKFIFTSVLALSLISCFGLGSNAAAAGWPTFLLVTGEGGSAIGLIDFNESFFTKAEAEELADLLQSGTQKLLDLLASIAPAVSADIFVYGPEVLASLGLGDADATNDLILDSLNLFKAKVYVKAVVTKVTPPQDSGSQGNNIRTDFYIYHNMFGKELYYVGSLEVVEMLIGGLRGLGNLF